MDKRALLLLMALSVFASPLAANAETSCPMMAGKMAMAPMGGLSAKASPCCPNGACDCSIQTPSPFQASIPQGTVFHTVQAVSMPLSSETPVVNAPARPAPSAESPPTPDKPYKLTAQYRI